MHRNERALVKRVLTASGQALLPMLELLEGAQASNEELTHEAAVALLEQMLMPSAQELADTQQRGCDDGTMHWYGAQRSKSVV